MGDKGISFALVWTVVACVGNVAHGDTFSCVVKGHGPYDSDELACLQLAKDQTRTDCNLNQADADVNFSWKVLANAEGKELLGACHSVWDARGKSCQPALCRKQNKIEKRKK